MKSPRPNDADLALAGRIAAALPDHGPPPPERYEELQAAGTWPLGVSKEMAAAYWAKSRTRLDAVCERCPARASATRDELVAASWLPCPRKGGKLAWLCPTHNPIKGPPPGMGAKTR